MEEQFGKMSLHKTGFFFIQLLVQLHLFREVVPVQQAFMLSPSYSPSYDPVSFCSTYQDLKHLLTLTSLIFIHKKIGIMKQDSFLSYFTVTSLVPTMPGT